MNRIWQNVSRRSFVHAAGALTGASALAGAAVAYADEPAVEAQ